MTTTTVRADVVGSLLRPDYLSDAKNAMRAGTIDTGKLRSFEDRAVIEAIQLQQDAGIEAITDGEFRRNGWICLLYTSPSPRDGLLSRMPSSA